jgi:hypothetical protein
MDTEVLVENRIEDGGRLLVELAREGFDVAVAVWVRTSEEGLWHLYIASDSVTPETLGDVYRRVYVCLRKIPEPRLSMLEIKLVHSSNSIARDAIAVRDRHSGREPVRFQGKRLGDLAIEEAYIYPATLKPMEVIAKGREEVLRYLEADSQARSGQPGEYLLARDESGRLIAFIAGHSFVGSGTIRFGGESLVVVNGIVVEKREE